MTAAAFLAVPATAALACAGCTDSLSTCIPGYGVSGLHVGLVLPILAGFVERPFFSLAGVERSPLLRSLQANVASAVMMAVVAVVLLSIAHSGPLGSFSLGAWAFASIPAAAAVEFGFVRRRVAPERSRRAFLWLLLGNVLSATLILTLPAWRGVFGTDDYWHIHWVGKIRGEVVLGTLAGCAAAYLALLSVSLRRRGGHEASGHGFEVLPRPTAAQDA